MITLCSRAGRLPAGAMIALKEHGLLPEGKIPGARRIRKKFLPGRIALTVIAGVAAAFLVAGCVGPDAICGSSEYPVKAVGNTSGRACVANGEQPPAGYVRYPAGKVPEHIGDKWDKYWSTKVVDKNGKVVG